MSTPTHEPTTCPTWCLDEQIHPGNEVLQPEVVHRRPLAAADGVHVALVWSQDVSPLDHPRHYYEPPVLVVDEDAGSGQVFLPTTPEVLHALLAGIEQARALLEGERW